MTKKWLIDELGISEEVAGKIFAERGKEIQESKDKIDELNATITDQNEQIAKLGETAKNIDASTEEIENLKSQLQKLNDEKVQREQLIEQEKIEEALKSRFNSLIGDKKWHNEDVEVGRYNAFKKAVNENNGKGDKEIFDEITKDQNCFVTNQKITIPSANSTAETEKGFKRFF